MTVPAAGLFFIYLFYRARLWSTKAPEPAAKTDDDGEAGMSSGPAEPNMAARRHRDLGVWIAIGWLFLVYTILCRTTFRSFACHDIEQESYHQTDYTIDCNSSAYKAYRVVAVFFVALYPVGIVAVFAALLYLNRRVLGSHVGGAQTSHKWWYGDRETLDFLVDGYRPATFWYELVTSGLILYQRFRFSNIASSLMPQATRRD